ncbi:MAG: rhomboid family intramembrane serine protease [Planctomycetes bacterium]|nr:rhomboid family intramembrane serine protease [Planctomycetota bacterium]
MTRTKRRIPWVTLFLVTVLATVFVTAVWLGTPGDEAFLVRLGAQDDGEVWNGGLYRVATALFVHAGWLEIALSCLSLLALGFALEPRVGSVKFALIYLVSGLAGGTAGLALPPGRMLSGATAGILGIAAAFVLLVCSRYDRYGYFRVRRVYAAALALALALLAGASFFAPEIDLAQHAAGLLAGAATAYLVMPPEAKNPLVVFRKGRVYREPVYLSVESFVRPRASQRLAALFEEMVRYDPGVSKRKVALVASLLVLVAGFTVYGLHPVLRYEYHLFRADREIALGNEEQALSEYTKMIERFEAASGPRPLLNYRLGILCAYQDRDQEALVHLDRAIESYEEGAAEGENGERPPLFIDARLWRQSIYHKLGQHERAEKEVAFLEGEIQRYIEDRRAPDYLLSLWLARVYVESAGDPARSEENRRRLERARELAEESVEAHPNARNLDVLGWSCYRLGDYEEARRILSRALAVSTDGSVYFHLGVVELTLERKEEGLDSLGRALACARWSDAADLVEARRVYDRTASGE